MKPRTKARSLALQVLYEHDMTNHPPDGSLQQRLEDELLDAGLEEFTRSIVLALSRIKNVWTGLSRNTPPNGRWNR